MNGIGNKTDFEKLTRKGIYHPSGLTNFGKELEKMFGNPYINCKKESEEIENAMNEAKSSLLQPKPIPPEQVWYITQSSLEISLNIACSRVTLPGLNTTEYKSNIDAYSRKIVSELQFRKFYKKNTFSIFNVQQATLDARVDLCERNITPDYPY